MWSENCKIGWGSWNPANLIKSDEFYRAVPLVVPFCRIKNTQMSYTSVSLRTYMHAYIHTYIGAVHTGVLDRSEIDPSQSRSEFEHLNTNWDRSKRVHFKCERLHEANWDRSQIGLRSIQARSISVWTAPYIHTYVNAHDKRSYHKPRIPQFTRHTICYTKNYRNIWLKNSQELPDLQWGNTTNTREKCDPVCVKKAAGYTFQHKQLKNIHTLNDVKIGYCVDSVK